MSAKRAAAQAASDMSRLRSLLFVPADSEKKIGKIVGCGADAVILDLEDAVAAEAKPRARALAAEVMQGRVVGDGTPQLWVRVNPLDSGLTLTDLAAVVKMRPDGIIQPKVDRPADVARLSYYLDALETAHGLAVGGIPVMPIATETAIAPFNLGKYAEADLARLAGLTWGAEDLSAAVSASDNRDHAGQWTFPYKMARSLTLLAAHACGVKAIETLYANFRDDAGLFADCREARRDGFAGRLAIHPAQVAVINEAFMPSVDEITYAQRVLDAFAAAPGAGTVGLDGKMLDIPHRKGAQRTLELAGLTG